MNGDIKKLCIVGYGRSGKDEAGMTLGRLTNLRYGGSTSWAALPMMAAKLNVHPQVAWETRSQYRQLWYESCNEFRRDDPTRLIRLVLESGDLVCGIRDKEEFFAGREQKLWDRSVWIHRPGNPVDPTITFDSDDCDEVVVNNYPSVEHYRAAIMLWATASDIPLKTPTSPEMFRLLALADPAEWNG